MDPIYVLGASAIGQFKPRHLLNHIYDAIPFSIA